MLSATTFFNNLAARINSVGSAIYELGSYVASSFQGSTLSNGDSSSNLSQLPEDLVRVNNNEEVRALKVLGFTYNVDGMYSKDALNKAWRKLAKERHSDKGGTDHLFREISEAKAILSGHSVANENHDCSSYTPASGNLAEKKSIYTNAFLNGGARAKSILEIKVKCFIDKVFELNKLNRSLLKAERNKFDYERNVIITDYKLNRMQLLAEYLKQVQPFIGSVQAHTLDLTVDLEERERRSIESEVTELELYLDSEVVTADANAFLRNPGKQLSSQETVKFETTLTVDSLSANLLLFKANAVESDDESEELNEKCLSAAAYIHS